MACIALPADAETLKGCVVGGDGNPKAFVTVEILASGRMQVEQTGENGCFSTNLSGGRYVVRIRENQRRQDFTVEVRGGEVDKAFMVKW